MNLIIFGIAGIIAVTIGIVVFIILRPSIRADMGGKVLIFIGFFLLPIAAIAVGTSAQMERSKKTESCKACHVMEPYVQSLYIDSKEYVPAFHFQNNLVPKDKACYTCHTTYTIFGDVTSKMRGVRHLYLYYGGMVPEQIKILRPYENRECLHCHNGARSFEENPVHIGIRENLQSNAFSCLGCHNKIHDVANLANLNLWKEGGK